MIGRFAIFIEGQPNHCHGNAGWLWKEDPDNTSIMTGYALSEDGMWRQHSWVLREDDEEGGLYIVETTKLRTAYFGYPMTYAESKSFFEANR